MKYLLIAFRSFFNIFICNTIKETNVYKKKKYFYYFKKVKESALSLLIRNPGFRELLLS